MTHDGSILVNIRLHSRYLSYLTLFHFRNDLYYIQHSPQLKTLVQEPDMSTYRTFALKSIFGIYASWPSKWCKNYLCIFKTEGAMFAFKIKFVSYVILSKIATLDFLESIRQK